MTAKGVSLHIGVNCPDPRRFRMIARLRGCENDAEAMRRLAAGAGFEAELLAGREARIHSVRSRIAEAARRVGSDGIFLLTYAGHGTRVKDTDGDEGDGMDEAWCLFDGALIDDEMFRLWALFPEGARIVVVSDSCHSGTVIRDDDPLRRRDRPPRGLVMRGGSRAADECASAVRPPPGRAGEIRPVRPPGSGARRFADGTEVEVRASVILLAAALDGQTAADGERHGAFTAALLEVWNGGAFDGSYADLLGAVFQRVRAARFTQEPQLERAGMRWREFEAQRPFTIAPPPAGGSRSG
jgi:hypothetical protein